MADREALTIRAHAVDRVEKWHPGSDTSGPADEVIEVVSEEGVGDIAPQLAAGVQRVERAETRKRILGLALTVGLALATGLPPVPFAFVGGLTTAGGSLIATLLAAQITHLGVGDDNTAFAVGQTDLQAATNKARIAMDATYPSTAANVITCRATAASGVANYAAGWLENGTFTASSGGTMVTRKAVNLGVKVSGATWRFTKTLTITTG